MDGPYAPGQGTPDREVLEPLTRKESGMTTLARMNHPETAKAAGRAMETNESKRARLITDAAAKVRQMPGKTGRELDCASGSDIDPRRVARRLDDAEKRGLVRRGDKRVCSITGRPAQTWWPVEHQQLIQPD